MRPGSKVVVGIGGNIGAGKTAAVGVFKDLGAECIAADELGWEVLPEIAHVLKGEFGGQIMRGCEIDRKKLRELIFSDPAKVRFLNHVSHPLLIRKITRKVQSIESGVVVIDAALLFDWPEILRVVDHTILIASRRSAKRKRAQAKDIDDQLFSVILSTQQSDQEMAAKADFVIRNDGTLDDLRDRCREIYERVKDDC